MNYVAILLLTIVLSGVRPENVTYQTLHQMALRGYIIDGIYLPLKNGALGTDSKGFAYKGKFIPLHNMTVAMRFAPIGAINVTNNEYKMYTYLDALNNPSVKDFGIPTIYYYGKWKNYTMLAMTLFDRTFQPSFLVQTVNESDIFFCLRESVRVMKYMHSKGVLHRHVTFDTFAKKDGRGFIFDFYMSWDMAGVNRRLNIEGVKYDYYVLLRSVFSKFYYEFPKSCWDWIGLSEDRHKDRMTDWYAFSKELAKDVYSDEWDSFTALRRILAEFAKHALNRQSAIVMDENGSPIPFYDHLYRFIIEEMQNAGMGATSSVPSLSDIADPFETNEWHRTTVKYELFEELYAQQISDARRKEME